MKALTKTKRYNLPIGRCILSTKWTQNFETNTGIYYNVNNILSTYWDDPGKNTRKVNWESQITRQNTNLYFILENFEYQQIAEKKVFFLNSLKAGTQNKLFIYLLKNQKPKQSPFGLPWIYPEILLSVRYVDNFSLENYSSQSNRQRHKSKPIMLIIRKLNTVLLIICPTFCNCNKQTYM